MTMRQTAVFLTPCLLMLAGTTTAAVSFDPLPGQAFVHQETFDQAAPAGFNLSPTFVPYPHAPTWKVPGASQVANGTLTSSNINGAAEFDVTSIFGPLGVDLTNGSVALYMRLWTDVASAQPRISMGFMNSAAEDAAPDTTLAKYIGIYVRNSGTPMIGWGGKNDMDNQFDGVGLQKQQIVTEGWFDYAVLLEGNGTSVSVSAFYKAIDQPAWTAVADTAGNTTIDTAMGFESRKVFFWTRDRASVWKIDEFAVSRFAGYLVIDDFEAYNDIPLSEAGSNLVYMTWADGVDNPNLNGSAVGYLIPFAPTMETTIVHGGAQSVPIAYDNTIAPVSKVTASTADLLIGANWTRAGEDVNEMRLHFYGQSSNDATEPMYIVLEDGDIPKHTRTVLYNGDANDVKQQRWQAWRIPLADFNDVNMANVAAITIGFGDPDATTAGGKGTIYFDDILLVDPNKYEEFAGPIVWYQLEDGSGNTAVDAMGHYNAVLRSPLWLAGSGFDGSGCLDFDDSQSLSIPRDVIANHVTTAMTIALWVRWDAVLPGAGWQPLISMNNQTKMRILCPTPQPQIQFFVATATEPLADGVVWGDGAAIRQLAGAWTHWAFTKNCATGEQSIYCNGRRVAHNATANKVATIPVPDDTDATESWRGKGLNFGGREAYHGFWGQGDGNGKGQLDDIRIYHRVLPDSQIADLAAGGTSGP